MHFRKSFLGASLLTKFATAQTPFTIQIADSDVSVYGRESTLQTGESFELWLEDEADDHYDFNSLVTLTRDPETGYLYTSSGTNLLSMYVRNNQDPYPLTLARSKDPNTVPVQCSVDDTTQEISCQATYKDQQYSSFVGRHPLALTPASQNALSLVAVEAADSSPPTNFGSCTYELKSEAPQGAICGRTGQLLSPATLGAEQSLPSSIDCLKACFGNSQCKSYGYDTATQTCQLYSKKLVGMRFRQSDQSSIEFYGKACGRETCLAPPLAPRCSLPPLYSGSGNYRWVYFPLARESQSCANCIMENPYGSLGDVDLLIVDYTKNHDRLNGQWIFYADFADSPSQPKDNHLFLIQNRLSSKFITANPISGRDVFQSSFVPQQRNQRFAFTLSRCKFFSAVGDYVQLVSNCGIDGCNVVSAPDGYEMTDNTYGLKIVLRLPRSQSP